MFDPETTRTPDQLEQELIEAEHLISQVRAHQLSLLGEIDRAQIATADGCRTLAEWTAGRLDITAATATALVRASRAIRTHPHLESELRDGHSSFDRTAATLRLAEVGAGAEVIERSRMHDLAAVARLHAQHRRTTASRSHDGFEARHLILQPSLDEEAWRVWGVLPAYEGHVIDKALARRADELPTIPDQPRDPRTARTVDALVSICADALEHREETESAGPTITIHANANVLASTDGEAGITLEGGLPVGLAILERALCEGSVELNVTADDGTPLAFGRTRRAIPPRLRREILHRDQGCTADGCRSRYRIQPHHVIPWSEGGPTDPDNLTSLCWFHHHVVVHGRGFVIDPGSPARRRRFIRGRPERDPP